LTVSASDASFTSAARGMGIPQFFESLSFFPLQTLSLQTNNPATSNATANPASVVEPSSKTSLLKL
jgi:hypothetical protein